MGKVLVENKYVLAMNVSVAGVFMSDVISSVINLLSFCTINDLTFIY